MKTVLLGLWLLLACSAANAQQSNSGGVSLDPFTLNDSITQGNVVAISGGIVINEQTSGLTPRSQAYNSGQRNLILIFAGQSICTSIIPTLYTPTSPSAIDNFSIYDGASWPSNSGSAPIGVEYYPGRGPGNYVPNVAQLFITNNIFDRVIYVPTCVGGTSIANWTTGVLSNRLAVTFARLAARGYVPGATGLTFALVWDQGQTDQTGGTSQAAYSASLTTLFNTYQSLCSGCRFFVNIDTWNNGTAYANVQNADNAFPNGTTSFIGGNIDSLGSGDRQSDNTHLNDTGRPLAATLVYNAMHASGAPF